MSDSSQRTEKPTPRRLEKAREEGRFLSSKEALSSVTLTIFITILIYLFPAWIQLWKEITQLTIRTAFSLDFDSQTVIELWQLLITRGMVPLLLCGIVLVVASLGLQLLISGFGIAHHKLKPELTRLNPWPRIKQMPGQNLFSVAQSIVLLFILAFIIVIQMPEWFRVMQTLPLRTLPAALEIVSVHIQDLLWKAVLIFLLIGAIDYFRQRLKYNRELRMTKQEIRDEFKESEGNPMVKQRIRRLQRDASRRRMMDKIPSATAIIVNPTHYSVAIHYDLESMAAPKVVAKGKNYLARRIREIAKTHQIPIVENPPLARSLYKSVDVGKEIPPALYRAVAEILAYIFRLMHGRNI